MFLGLVGWFAYLFIHLLDVYSSVFPPGACRPGSSLEPLLGLSHSGFLGSPPLLGSTEGSHVNEGWDGSWSSQAGQAVNSGPLPLGETFGAVREGDPRAALPFTLRRSTPWASQHTLSWEVSVEVLLPQARLHPLGFRRRLCQEKGDTLKAQPGGGVERRARPRSLPQPAHGLPGPPSSACPRPPRSLPQPAHGLPGTRGDGPARAPGSAVARNQRSQGWADSGSSSGKGRPRAPGRPSRERRRRGPARGAGTPGGLGPPRSRAPHSAPPRGSATRRQRGAPTPATPPSHRLFGSEKHQ